MKSHEFIRQCLDIIAENQLTEAHQISKADAHYTDNSIGGSKCANCRHFLSPNRCEIVLGRISPNGWCEHFEAKSVNEKWDKETKVSPSEMGKYAGRTKAELLKSYNALKASGPHHKGSKEYERMRELAFAIRAKGGWGKVS